jgi:proteasome lid subunit RPN8/RPN11
MKTPPIPLRVVVDRRPMAQLLAHSAETPDVEICGVLVGRREKDRDGDFVHVTATIRGEKAREEGSHVTFTHDTWNHIHREMDSKFAGKEIIGWYHTHPGFGIFLSDMDSFIHKNFFGQPHQVSLVHDPLAGKTGIFVLRGDDLIPLPRYWRDGQAVELDGTPAAAEAPSESGADLRALQAAVSRLDATVTQMSDRGWVDTWLTRALLLMVVLLLIAQYVFPPRHLLVPAPELEPLFPSHGEAPPR